VGREKAESHLNKTIGVMPNRDELGLKRERRKLNYPNGKNYLLVIGVDHYKNGIMPLNNAVRDARAFMDCLINYFQFEKENCMALFDEQASRRNLHEAFKTMSKKITDQDNFVFYFSGHGTKSRYTNAGYWMLVDSESGYEDSFFHNQAVIDFITMSKARHIYGIVDSCFSGTIFRKSEEELPRGLYQFKSRYMLTSGREEVVSDGAAGHHSPFAEALIHELTYCEQEIWGEDLARNVLRKIKYAETSQIPRGSYIHNVGHMGGEMIFMKKGAPSGNVPVSVPAAPAQTPEQVSAAFTTPTEKDTMTEKSALKELFVMGDYDKGFAALKEMIPQMEENTYYLLRSQYADYRSAKASGTRSDDQLDLIKRRLNNRILGFIDDL
jgi:hypothetical protein